MRSYRAGRPAAGLLSIETEPVRLRLLHVLALSGSCPPATLALGFSKDQASYGLRLLCSAGPVVRREQGRSVLHGLTVDLPEHVVSTECASGSS